MIETTKLELAKALVKLMHKYQNTNALTDSELSVSLAELYGTMTHETIVEYNRWKKRYYKDV